MPTRREPIRTAIAREQCPHCLQIYFFELERRCTVCDGPMCPFCVIRFEAQHFCAACHEEKSDAG
jgi:hypothetical protein